MAARKADAEGRTQDREQVVRGRAPARTRRARASQIGIPAIRRVSASAGRRHHRPDDRHPGGVRRVVADSHLHSRLERRLVDLVHDPEGRRRVVLAGLRM